MSRPGGAGWQIGVWGHSLGAVKTIYFLSVQGDSRIVRAIATSPPRFSYRAYRAREDGAAFLAYYERAEQLVDAGEPDSLFTADLPTSLVMTARVYVDKYGPAERYDILQHLSNVKTPLLVTIGDEEGTYQDRPDRFAFGGLAEKMAALGDLPNVTFELVGHMPRLWPFTHSWSAAIRMATLATSDPLVPGADHAYTNRTDQLWAAVERWLGHG